MGRIWENPTDQMQTSIIYGELSTYTAIADYTYDEYCLSGLSGISCPKLKFPKLTYSDGSNMYSCNTAVVGQT